MRGDASSSVSHRGSYTQVTFWHSFTPNSADRHSESSAELQRGSNRPRHEPSPETQLFRGPVIAHPASNSYTGSAESRVELLCGAVWEGRRQLPAAGGPPRVLLRFKVFRGRQYTTPSTRKRRPRRRGPPRPSKHKGSFSQKMTQGSRPGRGRNRSERLKSSIPRGGRHHAHLSLQFHSAHVPEPRVVQEFGELRVAQKWFFSARARSSFEGAALRSSKATELDPPRGFRDPRKFPSVTSSVCCRATWQLALRSHTANHAQPEERCRSKLITRGTCSTSMSMARRSVGMRTRDEPDQSTRTIKSRPSLVEGGTDGREIPCCWVCSSILLANLPCCWVCFFISS